MKKNGFTLIELLIAFIILGIATAIAIPGFARWLPGYRLKSASRELYANMQLAKMGAVKDNADWAIVFNAGSNSYRICSDDGGDGDWKDGDEVEEKTVNLTNYESGVGYGHGNATNPIGSTFGGDNISYTPDNPSVAVFNPRGTGSGGYVYLQNNKNTTTYGVGTRTSGVILLRKWNDSTSNWE